MRLIDWIENAEREKVVAAAQTVPPSFMQSKFDNISLLFVILVLVGLLVWVDKHGNGDFEKWLEVFTAGFGGAYLGLITGSRQAWQAAHPNNGGNNNGTATPVPSGTSISSK